MRGLVLLVAVHVTRRFAARALQGGGCFAPIASFDIVLDYHLLASRRLVLKEFELHGSQPARINSTRPQQFMYLGSCG